MSRVLQVAESLGLARPLVHGRRHTWAMPDPTAGPLETVPYANGNAKHRGAHRDGGMHGPWESYRLDGSLMRSGSFDRGRHVGVWRTYDRAGRVVKETTFR